MPLPTRIGRYAVRRRIGSGGFATVCLGYDESLDSPVAIKVLADNRAERRVAGPRRQHDALGLAQHPLRDDNRDGDRSMTVYFTD